MRSKIDKEHLKALLLDGHTLQHCADIYNCTREYIRQYRSKHLPELTKKNSGARLRHLAKAKERLDAFRERHKRDHWYLDELERAQHEAFRRKRQNARSKGKEFTIGIHEIEFPTHCPILGVELDWFTDVRTENSPSFDRVDCSKGYVAGNVVITSWRANRIKNDGTSEEHVKIAEWLKSKGL